MKENVSYPKNVFKNAIKLASYLCDPLVFEFRNNGLNNDQIKNLNYIVKRCLNEREQIIFNLRFKESMFYKEIAGELNISMSCVGMDIEKCLYKVILNHLNINYINLGTFMKNECVNPIYDDKKNYSSDICMLGISDAIIRILNKNDINNISDLIKIIHNRNIYKVKTLSVKQATIVINELYDNGLYV